MHSLLWIIAILFLGVSPALAQWQNQSSGTEADLRGLCAVSAQVAWASGTQGMVLRTVDGGKHWEKVGIAGAEALDFRDIQAFDALEATVLSAGQGGMSRIYKTRDGGKHWRLLFTNPIANAFYDGFAFWDRKHGFAMSDAVDGVFPLLITEDGETWKPLLPKALPPALPMEGGFAASGTNVAVSGKNDAWFVTGGPAARVFHSTDRGLHWEVVTSPIRSGAASQGIFSIAFENEHKGVLVGGDYSAPQDTERTAAYTQDGGKTWTLAEKNPAGYRSAAALVSGAAPTLWVAVGTSGSDYSQDGGKTWQPLDTGNYNAVSFTSSRTGWAVGPKGKIARFVPSPEK